MHDIKLLEEQEKIITETHERAHGGITENINEISREFYIPNLKAKVRKYFNLCKNCNTAKYDRKPYKIILPETPIPKNPLEILHIDIFILIHIKSRTIVDIRKALIKLFSRYGKPKIIISDN